MGIIYKGIFENGKSYIGYSKFTLEERINGHYKSAKANSQFILHKAIRKYGFSTIKWEVLEESNDEKYLLEIAEEKYIREHHTHYTQNGYNMTFGGQAGSNKTWFDSLTDEEREEYANICRTNLTYVDEEKRIKAMKESWSRDGNRKISCAKRARDMWANNEWRITVSQKISDAKKINWQTGTHTVEHINAAQKASAIKTKGTQWYNNGIKRFRLKVDDPLIVELGLIKGKMKNDTKRRI